MKRYLPLILLLTCMIAAFSLGLTKYLSFDYLKAERVELIGFVRTYPFLAPIIFIAIYITAVALSIPGAVFITLAGGFLFPQPFSTIYALIGASIGACILFQIAKSSLGVSLRERAGPFLSKMQEGFQNGATSYLLFLRLVPIFPFWLVNLAPALLAVPFRTFAWTTVLGILPGTFVFCQAGAGLGAVFDSGDAFTLSAVFNTQVKIALVALAFFALIPTIVKKIRESKKGKRL